MPLDPNQLFVLCLIALGGGVITLWVLIEHLSTRAKARARIAQTEAREETRREIAAYVAEGSISPDDAAKLMASGAEGITGGLNGLKASLRDCLDASAQACRAARGSRRQAARDARAQARANVRDHVQRVWGVHVGPSDRPDREPA
ncbi:MAG: hypothetical protein IPJ41_09945 [Phycisphaerales bacterium]|nr:hypothetical protein [Phycisphaerales bacterium]